MYIPHSCGLMAPVFFRVLEYTESIHRYWTLNLWAMAMVFTKSLRQVLNFKPRLQASYIPGSKLKEWCCAPTMTQCHIRIYWLPLACSMDAKLEISVRETDIHQSSWMVWFGIQKVVASNVLLGTCFEPLKCKGTARIRGRIEYYLIRFCQWCTICNIIYSASLYASSQFLPVTDSR